MKMQVGLCHAAGFNVRNMQLMAIFETAGRIINDKELTCLCLDSVSAGVLPAGVRLDVISGMSASDKAALRERISGKS